jgi:Ni2+-binding GTPase involved in maturation of urease and hydrogenase
MILTKMDLLPYVPFDVDRCLHYAHQVNPNLQASKYPVPMNAVNNASTQAAALAKSNPVVLRQIW